MSHWSIYRRRGDGRGGAGAAGVGGGGGGGSGRRRRQRSARRRRHRRRLAAVVEVARKDAHLLGRRRRRQVVEALLAGTLRLQSVSLGAILFLFFVRFRFWFAGRRRVGGPGSVAMPTASNAGRVG